MLISRRSLLGAGTAALSLTIAPRALAGAVRDSPINPQLLDHSLKVLRRHADTIEHRDVIGIVDFARPSWTKRFFLLDIDSGRVSAHYVAHGRGSDPRHSGWLRSFSNEHGSNASSSGAFVTAEHYSGKHGSSMRLDGLEPSNSNARDRAIVIHSSWYAEPDMIAQHGKLGRSEGCFTVPGGSLNEVLARLGPGRLLIAGKV